MARRGKPTKKTAKKMYIMPYKAKSIATTVKKQILSLAETKKLQTGFIEQVINSSTSAGAIYYVDAPMQLSQAVTYSGMVGHKVIPIGYNSRFLLHNNSATPSWVRYLCLVNKQGSSNTNYRTGISIFESNTGNQSLNVTNNSYLIQRVNRDLYYPLVDKVFALGGSSDADKIKQHRKFIKMNRKPLQFDGSGVLPTNNNIVEVWMVGQAADDGANEVEITGDSCFYYKDF
jgi:hypothetical protein